MTELQQDIITLYNAFPVWETSVWDSLQKKDYIQMEKNLIIFFNGFDLENWENIYWRGLINGIPLIRGSLTVDEWKNRALPYVVRAIRSAISDDDLVNLYSYLNEDEKKELRELMAGVAHDVARERSEPQEQQPQPTAPQQQEAPQPAPQPVQQQVQAPAPVQKTENQTSSNLLYPSFTERGGSETKEDDPTDPAQPAPFVLHEEESMNPLAGGGMAPLDRPQFFKSTVTDRKEAPTSTARLEIGDEVISERQRIGAKTKKEEPRVVNYTSPTTEVNPFVRPAATETPTPRKKEENQTEKTAEQPVVSPDNIVNLKDLPK